MKVLHIVENLDHGAVENWLFRMFRYAQASARPLDWTFYCQLQTPGTLEQEAKNSGAKVIHSPVPIGQKPAFMRALRTELKQGKYDVLHCHHDLVSAMYLIASIGVPLQQRIAHVHNADEALLTPSRMKKLCLREPMRRTCMTLADKIVGISNHTLDRFLHGRERREGRDLIHYYGIDPGPFIHATAHREVFRRDHGLPEDSLILLFAGRLVPEKNPAFVLEVLAALCRREPRAVGVFVGSGSEEMKIKSKVHALGLENATRFLGWRTDIPNIMCCCDWFILPRPQKPMEGFGIAVVEAQLAGLRLLLSHGIPNDPLLPGSCFRRLSLAEPADSWAVAACSLLDECAPTREEAARVLARSPMDMGRALAGLLFLYQE
jgi:glycosyltransferase involved in cell wall biosynthesis